MEDDEQECARDIEPGIDELIKAIDVDEAISDYEKMTDPYAKAA